MKVFVLYAQRNKESDEATLALANQLRIAGFEASIDQYGHPPTTWAQWSADQVYSADAIVVVCSPELAARFSGRLEGNKGKGARWEGRLLTQVLSESETYDRFLPVLIDEPYDLDAIPVQLRGAHCYSLWTDWHALLRRLRGESPVVIPDVGEPSVLPGRVLAIPGWSSVGFDNCRDLRAPLLGSALGPRDARTCPALPEVESLIDSLRLTNIAAIVGPSGSGKSLAVFQAAMVFYDEGWSVLRLADMPTGVAFLSHASSVPERKLLVIDDAHLLPTQAIQAFVDAASPTTRLILAATDVLPARYSPVLMDAERGVRTLSDHFRLCMADVLPYLQEIDGNIGDRWLQTPIDTIVDDASRSDAPWKFMFVLGRGELRLAAEIARLRNSDRYDSALLLIALANTASLDRGVGREWLQGAVEVADKDDDWLERALLYIQQRNLVRRTGSRYTTPHARLGTSIIERLLSSAWREDPWIRVVVRRLLADKRFPLRGRAWLVRAATRSWRWFGGHIVDANVSSSIWSEILASSTNEERTSASWMVEALISSHDDTVHIDRLRESPSWLVDWCHKASKDSAYPLADIVNTLINRDKDAASALSASISPIVLADRISRSAEQELCALMALADRLGVAAESPKWRDNLCENIDMEALKPLLASWPTDRIWALDKLLSNLLWATPEKAKHAIDALAGPLSRLFSGDASDAWGQIQQFIHNGMGFSPLLNDQRPSIEIMGIAKTIAQLISPEWLGKSISACNIRNIEHIAYLVQWAKEVYPDLPRSSANHVDTTEATGLLRRLVKESAHEIRWLLPAFSLDSDHEPAATLLRRVASDISIVDYLVAIIAPDVAVSRIQSGARIEWELSGALPAWDRAHGMLYRIWTSDPQVAERSSVTMADELADGLLLKQMNSSEGCVPLLRTLVGKFERAVEETCAKIDAAAARDTWSARIIDSQASRRDIVAVLHVVSSYSGPAQELARELLAGLVVDEIESK